MRVVVVVGLCTALLAGSVAGANAAKTYAGVKGGVNIAELTGDDVPDGQSSRNGFMGGGFFLFDFAEGFGVCIEGLYVQKGAEGPFETEDGDTHDATVRLDYLEFPVLFVVEIPGKNKLGVNLFAGPTFGFNLKGEVEIPEHGETEDLAVKSFEFGASIGGGIEYALSSFSIVVDGRYSIGATLIDDSPNEADIKNRGIGIMAGVKFPLGAH